MSTPSGDLGRPAIKEVAMRIAYISAEKTLVLLFSLYFFYDSKVWDDECATNMTRRQSLIRR